MAKNKYQEFYETHYGNKKGTSQLSTNQKKIQNYATRIASSGVNPEEALDKRNALEKALNLRQDQNVLFDVFELLGRPQQALFGGWENVQKGGDFLEGAREGIKGNKETRFKEILQNYGMEDLKGIPFTDIFGFVGDVFLDPADLIPLAGFGDAANVLKKGGSLKDAYKATDSLTDLAFKGAGKGLKKTIGGADNLIEKGLSKLDETKGVMNKAGDTVKLKYLAPGAKSSANLLPVAADGVQDITGATGRLELYKNAKNKFTNAFKVSDAAKDVMRTKRSLEASAETARETSRLKVRDIENAAENFVKKTNGKYGDARTVLNDASMLINSTVNRVMDEDTLVKLAKKGDMPAYDEAVQHLQDILKRDVSNNKIKQLEQKYGKDALSVVVDGNKIKLGKGWDDIELSKVDDFASELKVKQDRLREIQDIANDEEKLRKLSPYEAGMLEYEEEDLEKEISELINKTDNYTVKFNRRYTPEQEKKLSQLAQRYGYNEDGFRDFVDDIFGTAWKRQDSDMVTKVNNKLASKYAGEPLSKNQALLMENEPMFTGRSTARDVIDTSGKRVNAEQWFRDEPITPVGYTQKGTGKFSDMFYDETKASNRILSASDIGDDTGGVYAGLLSKSSPEKTLNLDAGKLGATAIPYKNTDFVNAVKTIPNNTRAKLEKIWNKSDDATSFVEAVRKDKSLVNDLKKLNIDVTSKNMSDNYILTNNLMRYLNEETTFNDIVRFDFNGDTEAARKSLLSDIEKANKIKNQDISYLYDMLNSGDGKLTDNVITKYFKDRPSLSDDIITSISNNQRLNRTNNYYDTVRVKNVMDPGVIGGAAEGDNVAIFNSPGTQPRKFKALSNKTPALDTESVFDAAEAKKGITKSSVDKLNDVIDNALNTNLGKQYNYLTNDNYVAARVLTPEGKNVVDEFNKFKGAHPSKGNSSLLNTRKYVGSPDEINNFFREYIDSIDTKDLKDYPALRAFKSNKDAKFMETDYIKALTNNYLSEKGLANVASSTQLVNSTVLGKSFEDYNELSSIQNKIEVAYKDGKQVNKNLLDKYKKLTENSAIKPLTSFDKGVPDNYTRMNSQEFQDFIGKYIKTNTQFGNKVGASDLSKFMKQVATNGNDIAINNDVLRIIGAASEPNNINGLNKLYNSYLNVFKKWKTASPTNFMNNILGNSSNMMLGGISLNDQARLAPQVIDIMTNGEKYYLQRLAGAKLDDAARKTANNWEQFRKMGFGNASLDLAELPEDVRDIIQKKKKLKGAKDYITNGLPSMFGYLNQKGDVAARLTVMLKANENPHFLKKLGAKDAYDAISKIMFDPELLTSTERKIKQVIPFYTYAKNNLIYHITNMPNNATRYNRLMKTTRALRNAATNGNEENMADYIKNSLYIPLPGLGKNGDYKVLRAQLPFGQLIEMVDNPVQEIMSMTSPLIKGGYEQATGIDTFTGRPIESFPGQKSSTIDLFGWSPSKRLEKAISDFSGLDVPLKTTSRLLSGNPSSAIMMQNNVDSDRLSRSYEQITDLQNLMKQYEQKGVEFSTLSELEKANKKVSVERINALLRKYGIDMPDTK